MGLLKKLAKAVAKVAPFVAPVIAIVAPPLLPAIGAALGASGAAATAVGAAVVSGSTAALTGAKPEDIAKAAAGAAAGTYFGSVAGEAVKATGAGTVATAAGAGAAGSGTSALVQTGDIGKALESAAKGAVISGGTQAGVEGAKDYLAAQPRGQLKAPAESVYQAGALGERAPEYQVGVTSRVPTGGGEGLVAPPNALYSSIFAPSQAMRATEGGGVQPAYQSGQSLITPQSLSAYSEPYKGQKTYTTPSMTQSEESLLREALQLGLGNLFTNQPQQATAPSSGTRLVGPTQTTATPGSQALAQALRVGDIGAPIFGGDKETGKRAGWNVESLRYMGNTEA